jgi:hypothetical protein
MIDLNQNSTETSSEWQSYNITSPDFSTIGTNDDVSYNSLTNATNVSDGSDQNSTVVIV